MIQPIQFHEHDSIAVIAPHPDDECLGAASALLNAEAAEALNRMCAAAEHEEGLRDYYVYSAWRSREEQTLIYRHRRREGYVALPGCSEHESGLCVDIDALDSQEMQLYRGWLERNSWRFGYILRYPKGREHITGIGYEPWHFRYVGENLAAILHEKDWTLEEYDSEVSGET